MVTDFINWIYKYENGSLSDVWHCFNYPGMHQFFHFVNFSIYNIISTNTTAWYLVLSGMHGLNVFIIFKLCKKLIQFYKVENVNTFWPGLVAFIFLIYPYNIETVIWKACLHYMITLQCLLIGFYFLLKYWQKENLKVSLVLIHFLFIVALFTLELSFIFPLMFLTLIFANKIVNENSSFKSDIIKIFLPQLALLAAYIILSKIALGNYIGHYGAEKHLVFDISLILSNGWKYFVKNLMFVHFYSFQAKTFLYEKVMSSPIVYYALSLGLAGLIYKSFATKSRFTTFITTNLFLFFLGLAPILTLYFYWLHPFENDRYGYFASLFFIVVAVSIIYKITHKYLKRMLLFLFIGTNLFYFVKMVNNANQATEVQHSLLSSFELPTTSDTIVILGMPDNYNGMYLFRDHKKNAHILRKSLSMMYEKDFDNVILDVAQFNQVNVNDGLNVTTVDDQTLRVRFNQTGNWFWKAGVGLSNYETGLFSVEVKPGFYDLHLKNKADNYIFLYTDQNKWKEFKFTKMPN